MDLSNTTPRALLMEFIDWMNDERHAAGNPAIIQHDEIDTFFEVHRLTQSIVVQAPEPEIDYTTWTYRQGRHNARLVYAMDPEAEPDADGHLIMTCDNADIAVVAVASHNELKAQREASMRAVHTAMAGLRAATEPDEDGRPQVWQDDATRCGAMDPQMSFKTGQCRYMAGHGGNHSNETGQAFPEVTIAPVRSNPGLCWDTIPGDANIFCSRLAGHEGWHDAMRPIQDGQTITWPNRNEPPTQCEARSPKRHEQCDLPKAHVEWHSVKSGELWPLSIEEFERKKAMQREHEREMVEGTKGCDAHQDKYDVDCQREHGHADDHEGKMANGVVRWPQICEAVAPNHKVQCSLNAGHDGLHTRYNEGRVALTWK